MFSNRVFSVTCIVQVEALTNQEEVELRSKIEALGLEVTKVPSKSAQHLDEVILTSSYIHFSMFMFLLYSQVCYIKENKFHLIIFYSLHFLILVYIAGNSQGVG